jgi:hypothetical protein
VQYVGALYHVMSRGDRREDILQSDNDWRLFLETLGQVCGKSDWQRRKADAFKKTCFDLFSTMDSSKVFTTALS